MTLRLVAFNIFERELKNKNFISHKEPEPGPPNFERLRLLVFFLSGSDSWFFPQPASAPSSQKRPDPAPQP